MTARYKPGIAVESGDQAFARAHSAYGCYEAAAVVPHNALERTILVKKRTGFVGAFDRDSDDQVRIADSVQAALQRARIIQRCPVAVGVNEAMTPFVRRKMFAVPPNNSATIVD